MKKDKDKRTKIYYIICLFKLFIKGDARDVITLKSKNGFRI